MKKTYTKPQMEVVKLQQSQMLCGSPAATGLSNPYGFDWAASGIADNEDDN